LLLSDILNKRNETGSIIFSSLYRKVNPPFIFKFLDEETSFWLDLEVIRKWPKGFLLGSFLSFNKPTRFENL
jgi:lycopene beta-cyclase